MPCAWEQREADLSHYGTGYGQSQKDIELQLQLQQLTLDISCNVLDVHCFP